MIVQYSRSQQQHQFLIMGESNKEEIEALLQHFRSLLQPQPGLQVQIHLDCTQYQGERTQAPYPPPSR